MPKYDYIIVGAGSAGCVLANRLSAEPSNSVLLLEAGGPDKKLEIKIPGGYAKLHKSEVDWGFWSEPQEQLNGRRLYLPRGKTLGGSSSTNAMAYVRGNRKDYDHWGELGNKGWDYNSLLPYFKKSEHNENFQDEFHGQNGPMNITFLKKQRTPFGNAFVKACEEVGIPRTGDYNGKSQLGASLLQFSMKNGFRHSTASAFLKPIISRPNLEVRTHAQVSKILIKNDEAEGVEYFTKKGKEKVYATKEVILSAGSFQSPQLLMLSGIGDPNELEYVGIETKRVLPGVGKNLQDHLFFPCTAASKQQNGLNHELSIFNQLLGTIQILTTRKGALTAGPLEATAFFDTREGNEVDFQLHFVPLQTGEDYSLDFYDIDTFPRRDGFTILPSLIQPKSFGFLKLQSNDPRATPLIQPNFLSHPDDWKTMIRGTRKTLDVLRSDAFGPYRERILSPLDESEEGIIQHIKKSVETIYHPVGTCKMGQDEMAVVDDNLRVHGIGKLRVIDASIMPRIISGNTNAASIMIGEKGADLILKGS